MLCIDVHACQTEMDMSLQCGDDACWMIGVTMFDWGCIPVIVFFVSIDEQAYLDTQYSKRGYMEES